MSDYVALQRINAPNSYAIAYQTGDPVTEQVVQDWGLQLGYHVELREDYQPPRPADTDNDRARWEAYVVGQGTSLDEARAASLDELRGLYEPPVVEPPAHDLPASAAPEGVTGTGATPVNTDSIPVPSDIEQPPPPDRPADSDLKSAWVDYVVAAGGDPEWARAKDTTKDDLIAWKKDG